MTKRAHNRKGKKTLSQTHTRSSRAALRFARCLVVVLCGGRDLHSPNRVAAIRSAGVTVRFHLSARERCIRTPVPALFVRQHHTTPTNLGLLGLRPLCARRFGYRIWVQPRCRRPVCLTREGGRVCVCECFAPVVQLLCYHRVIRANRTCFRCVEDRVLQPSAVYYRSATDRLTGRVDRA